VGATSGAGKAGSGWGRGMRSGVAEEVDAAGVAAPADGRANGAKEVGAAASGVEGGETPAAAWAKKRVVSGAGGAE